MSLISIDTTLFNALSTALRELYDGISVYGEYVYAPTNFPHVSIVEADNYTDTASLPLSYSPAAATLVYEINVYSNKTSGKKSEADTIMASIDEMMEEYNFVRTSKTPVSNLENATIYRIVARYRKLQPRT